MSEPTVIRPEYEAELRQMVRALEDAAGLHSRWVACSTLQATADTAIGELLSTVDAVRAERDTATARAEAAEQRAEALAAELAQARADRALLAGLWLGTVPPDVLPALLPTDPGDRDRLAAALDAVDLQASEAAHIAAGRAVIARIVAEMGGGAA